MAGSGWPIGADRRAHISATQPYLPYGRQAVDEDDIAAVLAVLKGDYLTTGPAVGAFEAGLAAALDSPFVVACSSGTAALHMAAAAFNVDAATVAIVPAMTFVATANTMHLSGAEVVFADVDSQTGLMTPDTLEGALSEARTRFPERRVAAVLSVHLNGQSADGPGIRVRAQEVGAVVIEDACHALGGTQRKANGEPAPIGSCVWSDAATFSFHPVKTIAAGEGGAVAVRDGDVAERLRRFRSHGISHDPIEFTHAKAYDAEGRTNPWFYEMASPGVNYRISDLHCVLGESQLRKLALFVEKRRRLVEVYRSLLAGFGPHVVPLSEAGFGTPAWHLMVVQIDFAALGKDRAAIMLALREAGVGSQVHYIPVHWQPYYRRRYGTRALPGAEAYYERALSLPLFVGMTEADVERVCDTLARTLSVRAVN